MYSVHISNIVTLDLTLYNIVNNYIHTKSLCVMCAV